ncbi:MAG: 30S ribosomal protein S16 [Chlorobi bacterium]|nr:30S ribosomal protein S16 [Chlorobiota bacterium]
MPVKIRLKREGRKKRPFYHIVIADSRAPRDGRFIEKIGYYNPNTNPATIELEFDKALVWLQKGAQPTDTCRAILSYKGVLYKNHLLKGAQKGAFSEEEAEKRFQAWMEDKESRIAAKAEGIRKGMDEDKKKRLAEEAKINQARVEELAKKQSELVAEIAKAAAAESAAEDVAEDESVQEAVTEEKVVSEEAAVEKQEATPEEKGSDVSVPKDESPVASEGEAVETETKTPETEAKVPVEDTAKSEEKKADEASTKEA